MQNAEKASSLFIWLYSRTNAQKSKFRPSSYFLELSCIFFKDDGKEKVEKREI